jgi:NAD(P)-dependent dehydrogenase (short-subunit alcohol dehydrogenase family)
MGWQVEDLFRRVGAYAQTLDLLINNAGIMDEHKVPIDQIDFDKVRKTFETDAIAPIRMIHSAAGMLRRSQRPIVVNISSNLSSMGEQDPAQQMKFGQAYAYR